jgi:homoserine kinase
MEVLRVEEAITAFAPASVSNVACGFDIMGFALSGAGDRVTVRFCEGAAVQITRIRGNGSSIPIDLEKNTAGPPVLEVARRCNYRGGLAIEIAKGLQVGSGIGSSASSAVAAAVAANALLDAGLSRDDLLQCALEGEKVASGAVHVDNLAPSLFGGFILVRGYDPVDVVPIRCPHPLWCSIAIPDVEIRTKESRKLLPSSLPLSDVVAQTGNAAGLVAGLTAGDLGLISRSLHDRIAEPVRKHLIPGYREMKNAALEAGALGYNISGSGPAVFALCADEGSARMVTHAMSGALKGIGCKHTTLISGIQNTGAQIVS